jgi:hypothetical protein
MQDVLAYRTAVRIPQVEDRRSRAFVASHSPTFVWTGWLNGGSTREGEAEQLERYILGWLFNDALSIGI